MQRDNTELSFDPRSPVYLLYFLGQAWANSVEVFLHRDFGHRYLGLPAASVVILLPVFMAAWPEHNLAPLAWYWVAYLAACLWARIGCTRRRMFGRVVLHSFYTGEPRLTSLRYFARLSERQVKQVVEPLLVMTLGCAAFNVNEPLGAWLLISGFCLMGKVGVESRPMDVRADDLNDRMLEQQIAARHFRHLGR
jgi:hypothetical protein